MIPAVKDASYSGVIAPTSASRYASVVGVVPVLEEECDHPRARRREEEPLRPEADLGTRREHRCDLSLDRGDLPAGDRTIAGVEGRSASPLFGGAPGAGASTRRSPGTLEVVLMAGSCDR